MNNLTKKQTEELYFYFEKSSQILKLPVHIIEKDFWVCWILDKLFSIDELKDSLIFKGGTSLSKVYNLIKRFSEDVDISIDKKYLGFSGEKLPENAKSSKKREQLLEKLSDTCKAFVNGKLKELINDKISHNISIKYRLEIDADDSQTLLFYYPISDKNMMSRYINPVVRIEFGARAEHSPFSMKIVKPYIEDAIPNALIDRHVEVKVLNAERTFWEKATILHYYAHCPDDKKIPPRQSRHYYDFYCLINSDIKNIAIEKLELLEAVAMHKMIYFRTGWAQYELAKKGSLKLIPQEAVKKAMEEDYYSMKEMFFYEQPDWNTVLNTIKDFENDFNSYNMISESGSGA